MKGNIRFAVFLLLLIGGMFALEQSFTKEFSWNPTFSPTDKQPFGCYVFDEVVSSSLKGNYSFTDKTFYQIDNDSTKAMPKALLSINDYAFMDSVQFKSMVHLLKKGYKIMFVSSNLSPILVDSLKITSHNIYLNDDAIKFMTKQVVKRKPLFLADKSFTKRVFWYYPQICNDYFSGVDPSETKNPDEQKDNRKQTWLSRIPATVIARNKDRNTIAFSKKVGKGELFIVSNPLLFTNYGILDQKNAAYVFSLLSYMKGLPLVRCGVSESKSASAESPLRYILSQPSLRWSLYLTLITILLFMFFTAKRRQKVIPIIEAPLNQTLDFVKLIGTLYYQKKDHLGLLRKKQIYFVQTVKRETNIDIEEEKLTPELCRRLSNKTGMEPDKINKLLSDIEMFMTYDYDVDDKTLREYIDRMNEFIINCYK